MKRYLKVGIIFAVLVAIIVTFSWFVFPAWRHPQSGGFWTLLALTLSGVFTFIRDLVQLWIDLRPDPKDTQPSSSAQSIQSQQAKTIYNVSGGMVILGKPPRKPPESPLAVPPGPKEETLGTSPALNAILQQYINRVISEHDTISMKALDTNGQPFSISVEQIYQPPLLQDLQTYSFAPTAHEASLILKLYRRLVITGPPGSGKSTFLSYLALTYARSMYNPTVLLERLSIPHYGELPIYIALRHLSEFLTLPANRHKAGDREALILEFLSEQLRNKKLDPPGDFIKIYVESGQAILLFDGLDETGKQMTEMIHLIEVFVKMFPSCRYIVTCRQQGYRRLRRIGEHFGLARLSEFNPYQIKDFIEKWMSTVIDNPANTENIEASWQARRAAEHLFDELRRKKELEQLAKNPLLLTTITLLYKNRLDGKQLDLPVRRAELYSQVILLLMHYWDRSKGLKNRSIVVKGGKLRHAQQYSLIKRLAFGLHAGRRDSLSQSEMDRLLSPYIHYDREISANLLRQFRSFLIRRAGLLTNRNGEIRFFHLTFQSFLAACYLAKQKDWFTDTLERLADPWWQEAIILEIAELSLQPKNKAKINQLIQAICKADSENENEPCYALSLAWQGCQEAGFENIEKSTLESIKNCLTLNLNVPPKTGTNRPKSIVRKIKSSELLVSLQFHPLLCHHFPYQTTTDLIWKQIPEGPFWMGEKDSEMGLHQIFLPAFHISHVPITNAQYLEFVKQSESPIPSHWKQGKIPSGLENHPVVNVTWDHACRFCDWLSELTGKKVQLPSEAEWEKAARGSMDQREHSWGAWNDWYANTAELRWKGTIPVGIFSDASSPYGVLDMCGNVWEWTRTAWYNQDGEPFLYAYDSKDGRENLEPGGFRVIRGGAFSCQHGLATCTTRFYAKEDPMDNLLGIDPDEINGSQIGFRVVCLEGLG